jgi:integrase
MIGNDDNNERDNMRGSPINLTQQQPAIMAENLPELVEAYIESARGRLSPLTLNNYDYFLSHLLLWWAQYGPSFGHRLGAAEWAAFGAWLEVRKSTRSRKPLTKNHQNRTLALCRQLLRWAYRGGYLDRDFSSQVPTPKGISPLRDAPSVEDLVRLLDCAGETRKPRRDQAIIALLAGTGIRRAECAGIEIQDIHWIGEGGRIDILRAKGGRPRVIVFDAACGAYLRRQIEEVGRQTGPLFTGWRDEKLSPKGVYAVVKAMCKAAGIDEMGRGPHDLRRLFATAWVRALPGLGSAALLCKQLGHTSAAMTTKYLRLGEEDQNRGFASPLTGGDNVLGDDMG